MRVPEQYLSDPNAELLVRIKSPILGNMEVAKKLSDLPKPAK